MQIEARQLSKTYHLGDVPVQALKGVDILIAAGDFVAISGPSGSGKTTLLNILGTIDVPTAGQVLYRNRNIAELTDDEQTELRNKEIGFIFQTFNLVPVLTALENVMLPLGFSDKINVRQARETATRNLEAVGLENFLHHKPNKLSGGQRQRVAIARALSHRPPLIIADEPTANLDSDNARQILDTMIALNKTENTTFIFSTHDSRLLEKVKRIVKIEDGRIVSDEVRR